MIIGHAQKNTLICIVFIGFLVFLWVFMGFYGFFSVFIGFYGFFMSGTTLVLRISSSDSSEYLT